MGLGNFNPSPRNIPLAVGQGAGSYIDSHVHIWTYDSNSYRFATKVPRREVNPMTFSPESVVRHAQPSGISRIVLVQMNFYGTDNSYLLDAIRRAPRIFSGIAVVDWKARNPCAKMRELAKAGIRGFRIYPESSRAHPWLDREGFDEMFRCGGEENLAMCTLLDPWALPELARQCEKFPDTPVIIDHLARIGADGEIRESDVKSLCAFSRYPSVKIKVSAFYALGEKKPPHLDLAPLIHRVHEAFGPRRLMWGSDCPFQLLKETCEHSISLVRDHLPFLSAEDKEWILRRTAEELFFA